MAANARNVILNSPTSCNQELRYVWCNLLSSLKSVVEELLANCAANIWSSYGGLTRLTSKVENILSQGLRIKEGIVNYWLCISTTPALYPEINVLLTHRFNKEEIGQRWIEINLQEHTLSQRLSLLVQDRDNLHANYEDDAFLCQDEFVAAFFLCLQAIEQNRPLLLAEIDPKLLVFPQTTSFQPSHYRKCSLPSEPLCSEQLCPYQTPELPRTCQIGRDHVSLPVTPYLPRRYIVDLTPVVLMDPYFSAMGPGLESGYPPLECSCDDYLQSPCVGDKKVTTPGESALKTRCEIGIQTDPMDLETEITRFRKEKVRPSPSLLNVDYSRCSSCTSSIADLPSFFGPAVFQGPLHRSQSFDTNFPNELAPVVQDKGVLATDTSIEESTTQFRMTHARSKSDGTFTVFTRESPSSLEYSSTDIWGLKEETPSIRSDSPDIKGSGSRSYKRGELYLRRPAEGESLTSFLASQDFTTCAELEKEDAHFRFSEALIAAFERVRCSRLLKNDVTKLEEDESDDELQLKQQKIRLRKRKSSVGKNVDKPNQTTSDSSGSSTTEEEVDDIVLTDKEDDRLRNRLKSFKENGLSLSLASLYSDADIGPLKTPTPEKNKENLGNSSSNNSESTEISEDTGAGASAKTVALNLLRQFSESQLPSASDLECLLAEEEPLEQLVPESANSTRDFDIDESYTPQKTRLRGNLDWAPPRAQIISIVHPTPRLRVMIAKQNYRCAGCGIKVEPRYIKRLRYCEYLGKYFCQCCHSNTAAYIPGRILSKWDFNKYYVSNFARDLLERIFYDPLFNVQDVNPNLYRKTKMLEQVLDCRLKLFYLKDFIRSCSKSDDLLIELEKQPLYLLQEPHVFSLSDLLNVKSGFMLPKLRHLLTQAFEHFNNCQLCQAKGFICEICKNYDDVIYPFQLQVVTQCQQCWACFHKTCFDKNKCPKCARIEWRRLVQDVKPASTNVEIAED